MKITNEIKKQKAIELMNKLNIYKPYIRGFENDNMVCFFENFGGFWAYQEPELMAKIKEIEKTYKVLVYAVTHEYLEFGECYDFLYVPDYFRANYIAKFTADILHTVIILFDVYTKKGRLTRFPRFCQNS